jgi:hypothetical protein
MAIAPFKPHRVQAYLFGSSDRYLTRPDRTGHHFERVVRHCMIGLPADGTGALFAQQIEGVDTAMSISPLNGHGAIGDMHFNIRRIGFA